MQVGGCFGFGIVAQCDGHDFGLAEEETASMLAIDHRISMYRDIFQFSMSTDQESPISKYRQSPAR